MQTYQNLIEAIEILKDARKHHSFDEPAWDFLNHAVTHLTRQANKVMRGEA